MVELEASEVPLDFRNLSFNYLWWLYRGLNSQGLLDNSALPSALEACVDVVSPEDLPAPIQGDV